MRLLLATEEKTAGFVAQTLEHSSRIRNILDYCLNALEMMAGKGSVCDA